MTRKWRWPALAMVLAAASFLIPYTLAQANNGSRREEPARRPAAPVPSGPVERIMVVGDSITQGSSGDYTWRYRLWRHLTDRGVRVDLVGPRDDL